MIFILLATCSAIAIAILISFSLDPSIHDENEKIASNYDRLNQLNSTISSPIQKNGIIVLGLGGEAKRKFVNDLNLIGNTRNDYLSLDFPDFQYLRDHQLDAKFNNQIAGFLSKKFTNIKILVFIERTNLTSQFEEDLKYFYEFIDLFYEKKTAKYTALKSSIGLIVVEAKFTDRLKNNYQKRGSVLDSIKKIFIDIAENLSESVTANQQKKLFLTIKNAEFDENYETRVSFINE